jgi:site-specific recombinase XerC
MLDFVDPIGAGGRFRSFNRLSGNNEPGRKRLDPHDLFRSARDNSSSGAGSRCEDRFVVPAVSAIRHFHYLAGVDPAPTDVAIVKSTMKGLRHSLGQEGAGDSNDRQALVDVMPGGTLKGRRDRAMVMLGFAGALGKSEVVALNVEDLEICDPSCAESCRLLESRQYRSNGP